MENKENILTEKEKTEIINSITECILINNPQHLQDLNKIELIQAKFKIKQQLRSYYK